MKDFEYFEKSASFCYIPNAGERTFYTWRAMTNAVKNGRLQIEKGSGQVYEAYVRTPKVDIERLRKEAEWMLEDGRLGEDMPYYTGSPSFPSIDDEDDFNRLRELFGALLGYRLFATDNTIEITDWFFDQMKGEKK